MFKVELAALVHEEPADPVMPPDAVVVSVPLFVTAIVLLMEIVPEKERLAVERIDFAPVLIVNVALFVIDPVPSMFVLAPLRVMAPVPLTVPFTTKLPAIPSVNVEVLRVAPAETVRLPDNVVLPASVAPLELLTLR